MGAAFGCPERYMDLTPNTKASHKVEKLELIGGRLMQ